MKNPASAFNPCCSVPIKTHLLPCLVTSSPEDGDSMFLRNVGIDLKIHNGAKTQDLYNMKNPDDSFLG
jgi:hypothetical protein